MIRNYSRGFTLIELLVVIAIIGILSSVVLASLNSARNKGADAAVKSNLAGIRAQAEIYYDTNGQYNSNGTPQSSCNAQVFAETTTRNAILAALSAIDGTDGTNSRCNAYTDGWAVSVGPLKATTSYWCVDSKGSSKSRSSLIPNSGTAEVRTTC